nr:rRNA biogenesis protein RRP36-like [Aegilops tauschii subsp. strangulata]
MDSEEEATDTESDDEEFYKKIGKSNAYVAIKTAKNISESDTDDDASSYNDSSDDEPIAFCLMAKSSKDQLSTKHQISMNKYSPEYISYAKLVKIAKSQHDELEMLERNLRKTEGLLVEEMEKNQKLIEEQDAFSSTIEDLTNRYDSLAVDYESL